MKKFFITLMGGTVVLIGVAMLVLPGPGLLVVLAGLAILATEFIWARRALRNAKGTIAKARRKSGLKEWLRRRRRACSVASVNSILESISEAKASVASRAELMDSRMRLRW